MKWMYGAILAFAMLVGIPAAYGQASLEVEAGGVKYRVDKNNDKAYVVGYKEGLTEAIIQAKVTDSEGKEHAVVGVVAEAFKGVESLRKVAVPGSVMRVDNRAFSECTNLAEVSLAEGLTSIGEDAFHHCALTQITIPASVKRVDNRAFSECTNLAEVSLAEGLTSIGEDAFHHCALTQITIPASVKEIGANPRRAGQYSNPFAFCSSLKTITLASGSTAFYQDTQGGLYTADTTNLIAVPCTLSGSYTTAPELEEIHAFALGGCSQLTEVNLTNKVNTLYRHAFDQCSSLKRIKLPESLEYFNGGEVFYNCSSLEAIEVDSKNKNFVSREGVLYGEAPAYGAEMGQALCCYPAGKKGKYQIPADVKRIEDCAFKGCRELTGIEFPPNLVFIGMHAFYGCEQIDEVMLPASLTECQGSVFADCKKLKRAEFATGATAPDFFGAIFENCVQLSEVKLPENLEKIPQLMFLGCKSLTEVTIPSTVTVLECLAFKNCTKLSKVICLAPEAPELQANFFPIPPLKVGDKEHFQGIAADATLYVPAASVGKYEASEWKDWFPGGIKALGNASYAITIAPTEHGQVAASATTAEKDAQVTLTVTPDPGFALDALSVKDAAGQELSLTRGADNTYTFTMVDKAVTVTATFKSTVVLVASIVVSPALLDLKLGDAPVQLEATIVPAEATNRQLTWSSDNDNVATVDVVGMVTAKAEGRTTIWATAQDGSLVKAKCLVTVTKKNQPLAVESTLLAGVTAYPLPVHNELHIGQATNVTRIVVYDLLGNIRMEQAGNGQLVQTLYLEQLPKGIYLVQLLAPDGQRTLRIAKE